MKIVDRVALLLIAPLALLALVRVLPADPASFPLVAIEAESAWLFAPAWIALAWGLARRAPWVVAPAAAAALVHAALVLPLAVGSADPGAPRDAATLRFVDANVLAPNARRDELAAELAALDADVMTIEELTPEWVDALEGAGALAHFPHRVVLPRDDCFGIALLSRSPIVDQEIVDLGGVPAIRARLRVEERDVTVIAVHTLPPRTAGYAEVWAAQMDALGRMIDDDARAGGRGSATILAGDLNASPVSRGYRGLLAHGVRGAHESAGRGLASTWPNGLFPLPPMRLDHVLVRGAISVRSVREGVGAGSDHRPVVVELALSRPAGA